METLPLELEPGQDLHLTLSELAMQQQLSGFVLGIVGNLSQATFRCPGQQQPTRMNGELEVITLNGTFSPSGVHLHLSLSDGACQVWGGHLEPGTLVQKSVDLLLGVLEESPSTQTEQAAAAPPRIEIAVLPGCPWSARAVRMLRTLNLPHTVTTVNDDNGFLQIKTRSEMTSFPQVFLDGAVVGGHDELAAMHAAGELETLR